MIILIFIGTLATLGVALLIYFKLNRKKERKAPTHTGVIINDNDQVLQAVEMDRQQLTVFIGEIKPVLRRVDENVSWLRAKWEKFQGGNQA